MSEEFEVVPVFERRVRGSDVDYYGGKWVLVSRGYVAAAGNTLKEAWENFFETELCAEHGVTRFHHKWDEAMYQYDELCRRMGRSR